MDEWINSPQGPQFMKAFTFDQPDVDFHDVLKVMSGEDSWTLGRLLVFLSEPTPGLKQKYCLPVELVQFWKSLSDSQRDEFRLFVLGLPL